MKRIALPKHFLVALALFMSAASLSSTANADASCRALLADLSQHLAYPSNSVTVLHMTNYQANGQWWGGWTQTNLTKGGNGHLIGSGNRLISNRIVNIGSGGPFGQSQPFSIRQPDPITYDIDLDGKIIFDGQYGPYDMTCAGNKFAFFNSGDSLENFSFSKGSGPR